MVLGRKNKKVEKDIDMIKSAFQQEEPDLEVELEQEQPIEQPQPIVPVQYAQPQPVAPVQYAQPQPVPVQQPAPIPQPVPVAPQPVAPVEEPLKIRIISGEVTETGFVYTIVANKQFANIGDVINMQ